MRIVDAKTLHMTRPLGIGINPYFSWILESDEQDVRQVAWRVVVEQPGGQTVWDTGRVADDRTAYIEYGGEPLDSRTRYGWTVTSWDNKGNASSACSEFETALLKPEDWKARWAESVLPYKKRKKGLGNQPPATLFRKSFDLGQEIVSARLYATCHGIYRLTVNGKRVDDREFAPEHTAYGKYLCYQTYDVTELLQQGKNALGMHVGDGWYCGARTRPNDRSLKQAHAVLFQLEVTCQDGSRFVVVSDNDVRTFHGPVLYSDLFSGEKYDANREIAHWDEAAFNDSTWKNTATPPYGTGNLVAQLGQPVRPVVVVPAVEVLTSPRGEKIVDFGQIMAGRVRMHFNEPQGAEIILDHFETLDQDGNYFNNLNGLGGGVGNEQQDTYISNGQPSDYEPLFTFHGFRYIRVQGVTDVRAEDFTAVALSSEKEDVGSFACSDTRLNRLYENTRWSQRSNMLSIPTDCPHREKAGWTGDIQLYATTALLNEDVTPFLTRWLQNLACEQFPNGGVPFVVPNCAGYPRLARVAGFLFGNKGEAASAGWGDAAVLVPFTMYQMTGNMAILRQQYDSMKAWCDYIIHTAATQRGKNRRAPREVDRYLWNTGFHFGEWLIPSMTVNGYGKEILTALKASLQYIAPVYACYSLSSMAQTASLLGEEKDALYYSELCDKMRRAFGVGVINENGDMPVELMGAYVLPIYFDLIPDGLEQHFANKLVDMIHANGGCLDTGFLGTPFILDALCKIGYTDMAYQLLYQEKCPSWLYEVKHGATTIWESWYGYKEDGTPMIVSLNHYAFGCVDDWMFRTITGIDKTAPGFKHILIEPRPDDSLTWARRRYRCEHGDIESNWRKEDGRFILEIAIPCNTGATVKLPDGQTHEIGSGQYTFSCAAD